MEFDYEADLPMVGIWVSPRPNKRSLGHGVPSNGWLRPQTLPLLFAPWSWVSQAVCPATCSSLSQPCGSSAGVLSSMEGKLWSPEPKQNSFPSRLTVLGSFQWWELWSTRLPFALRDMSLLNLSFLDPSYRLLCLHWVCSYNPQS